jgi:hypothetical protein
MVNLSGLLSSLPSSYQQGSSIFRTKFTWCAVWVSAIIWSNVLCYTCATLHTDTVHPWVEIIASQRTGQNVNSLTFPVCILSNGFAEDGVRTNTAMRLYRLIKSQFFWTALRTDLLLLKDQKHFIFSFFANTTKRQQNIFPYNCYRTVQSFIIIESILQLMTVLYILHGKILHFIKHILRVSNISLVCVL